MKIKELYSFQVFDYLKEGYDVFYISYEDNKLVKLTDLSVYEINLFIKDFDESTKTRFYTKIEE